MSKVLTFVAASFMPRGRTSDILIDLLFLVLAVAVFRNGWLAGWFTYHMLADLSARYLWMNAPKPEEDSKGAGPDDVR